MMKSCPAKQVILILTLLIVSRVCLAQGLAVDRFCDIYAETAPRRLEKIIRLFTLSYRPVSQLNGRSVCQNGDIFKLKTSCVGPHRVAILSLSNPDPTTQPSAATKLFHLYTTTGGDKELMPCQVVED